MALSVSDFREHVLEGGVLHPEGIHHEFAYSTHGRKLDFDVIPDASRLYEEWVELNVDTIRQRCGPTRLPVAVVGVARGTNRLSPDVAARLGIVALYTRKISPREVMLTDESRSLLLRTPSGLTVVLEDVGTTGGTALTAAESVLATDPDREVEGQFTWQRQSTLASFDIRRIPYNAIINEPLPTYTPERCRQIGYCAQGWELIPHAK